MSLFWGPPASFFYNKLSECSFKASTWSRHSILNQVMISCGPMEDEVPGFQQGIGDPLWFDSSPSQSELCDIPWAQHILLCVQSFAQIIFFSWIASISLFYLIISWFSFSFRFWCHFLQKILILKDWVRRLLCVPLVSCMSLAKHIRYLVTLTAVGTSNRYSVNVCLVENIELSHHSFP